MNKSSSPSWWVKILMLLAVILSVVHILTEFVILTSVSVTRIIAYITAVVFTITTIAYLIALMLTRFTLALKVALAGFFLMWVFIYAVHLYFLRDPSGWGATTGFMLFGYNWLLLISYYCLLKKQEAIVNWHERTGL